MARRREHTLEQIREMVLSSAENIINQDGVEALTARKIATDIGYTVGSIYMVFANMQELTTQIKSRTLEQLAQQWQEAPVAACPATQLNTLALHYHKFAAENLRRWRILFQPSISEETEQPDWYKEKLERLFNPLEILFRQLNPQAQEDQIRLAAKTMWCGVHGVCLLALNGSLGRAGFENTESAVTLLVDNFIQGWRP